MSFWTWSRTAASNSTADSTINWAEGQAPSSVNDSARATMAAVAKYRDDIAGAITTGGTSTAYTVASYQVFDTLAHMANAMIAFVPHATNGATVTLNVDGLGAKPLRPAPSVELQTGALILGTPYVATYNNSDAVWYLQGAANYNSYSVPIGAGMDYWGTTAPNSSFVFAYGQAISRTTYSVLYNIFGTTFGVGDGSSTFNIPDLRGRSTFYKDNMGGSSASRITNGFTGSLAGTTLGAVGGEEGHTILTAEMPSHTHTATDSGHGHSASDAGHTHATSNSGSISGSLSSGGAGSGSAATFLQGAFALNGATTGSGSASISVSTGNAQVTNSLTGGGTGHNNMPPGIICNYIIRVL